MITRRKFITGSAAAIVTVAFLPDTFSVNQDRKLKNFGFISGIIGNELKGDWRRYSNRLPHSGTLRSRQEIFLVIRRKVTWHSLKRSVSFLLPEE